MQASMIFTSNGFIINLGVIIAGLLVLWLDSGIPDLVVGTIVCILMVQGTIRTKTRKIAYVVQNLNCPIKTTIYRASMIYRNTNNNEGLVNKEKQQQTCFTLNSCIYFV